MVPLKSTRVYLMCCRCCVCLLISALSLLINPRAYNYAVIYIYIFYIVVWLRGLIFMRVLYHYLVTMNDYYLN